MEWTAKIAQPGQSKNQREVEARRSQPKHYIFPIVHSNPNYLFRGENRARLLTSRGIQVVTSVFRIVSPSPLFVDFVRPRINIIAPAVVQHPAYENSTGLFRRVNVADDALIPETRFSSPFRVTGGEQVTLAIVQVI